MNKMWFLNAVQLCKSNIFKKVKTFINNMCENLIEHLIYVSKKKSSTNSLKMKNCDYNVFKGL